MKFLFIILTIPGLSLAAFRPTPEKDCSPLYLADETLGLNKDQGKVSWCYAFTASDMLAHTFGLKTPISSADIALNYNESPVGRIMDVFTNNGSPHQTGFSKVALIEAMKDGYCPEEVFPSENWTLVQNDQESQVRMSEAMTGIEKLHKIRHTLNEKNLPYYYKFPNVGPSEFVSLLQVKKLRHFYSGLRRLACKDSRMSFDTRWKVKMVFKNPRVFSRVSEQMEEGRLVALDYDARILENRDHRGLKISELHTSSLIGRRWNKERNSCEYLIRDSRGAQCRRYDPRYECHQGNVWLSESEIYGSMTSIVYMLSGPR